MNTDVSNPGLLMVSATVPTDRDEFFSWYFDHVRDRMTLDEFSWMSRGVSIVDREHHVAVYGLDDLKVLESTEYKHLRSERSSRERMVLALLPRPMDRSKWEAVGGFGTVGAQFMLIVRMSYPATDRLVVDWYLDTHLPFLATVPGWVGARTFERTAESGGREHVAIHWLSDLAVRQSEMLKSEKLKDRREWFLKEVTASSYEEFEVLQSDRRIPSQAEME